VEKPKPAGADRQGGSGAVREVEDLVRPDKPIFDPIIPIELG
jgi:3-deoxy-D-manno-octulosonate 8-phosphate phosphatase KdsC-like HAD superfamily phosphatase